MAAKLSIAKQIFGAIGRATTSSPGYAKWFHSSAGWLRPYAAFCLLRDLFGTAEHWRWGALATATPELIARLTDPAGEFYSSIEFTYYLQVRSTSR